MWAREHGTHGRIVWSPLLKCAEIQLDLHSDDPRMRAWKEGRLPGKPVESVFLHRQAGPGEPFVGIPVSELGVEGVRKWLDRGNLQSGRGRHASMDAACKAADRANQELEERMSAAAAENARYRAREHRRELFDLPMVSVPAMETDNG